jgi:hypothetical protein
MNPYQRIAIKALGLSEQGHRLGVFQPIALAEPILDKMAALRLATINPVLEERYQEGFTEDEYLVWAENVQENYFLRYSRFLYLLKNLKTYKPDSWRYAWKGTTPYFEVRDAIVETHFVNYLNKRGPRYEPTPEGWKQYLRDVSEDFYDFLCQSVPVVISESARLRHTYLCGSSGHGKTETLKVLIYSYLVNYPECAVVVIEPSGQLAPQIARWREHIRSDRLIYLTTDRDTGRCPVINPFQISGVDPLDRSTRATRIKRVVAQELVKGLSEVIAAGDDSELSTNMEAVLSSCVTVLLNRKGSTLNDLVRFMDDSQNQYLIDDALTLTNHKRTLEFFQTRFKGNMGGLSATKTAIFNKMHSIMEGGALEDFTCGESTIDLEHELNEGKFVVFDLAKGKFGEQQSPAIGRLVVALLRGIAFRREDIPESKRVPCHVFIDEFPNFVSDSVTTIMQEARKFKIILTLCQTELGDMPPQTKDAVFNNATLRIIGAVGKNVGEAARFIHVQEDQIRMLASFHFLMKVENRLPAIEIAVESTVTGDANAMSEAEWQRVWAKQLERYYPAERHLNPVEPPRQRPTSFDVDHV